MTKQIVLIDYKKNETESANNLQVVLIVLHGSSPSEDAENICTSVG